MCKDTLVEIEGLSFGFFCETYEHMSVLSSCAKSWFSANTQVHLLRQELPAVSI